MQIADDIEEFLTGMRAPVTVDRVLATVLFTDIVSSTEKAAALGDRRWRDLLDNHHATIRRNLVRFRGHEVKTTGDGILATFDGPARGVRCACAKDQVDPIQRLISAAATWGGNPRKDAIYLNFTTTERRQCDL
jgi:class 3 adenylate cyclase